MRNVFVFLAIVLIGLVVVSFSGFIYSAIPGKEREALIALYKAANGGLWNRTDGWKGNNNENDGFSQRGSEDSWYGITVSENRVTSIILVWNNLTGRIPKELGDLSDLKELQLGANNLSAIAPELGNLKNLTVLSLSQNPLIAVPPELGNLSNLTTLWLSNAELVNIPPGLGNLSNLVKLYLGNNNLSGIPPELGNLNNLKWLSLNYNNLASIPPELGNLSNLERLYLEYNNLSEIPPELGNLGNLKELYLYENQLTTIPPELGNLDNLRSLKLHKNHLKYFPEAVLTMTNLSFLDLSHNKMRGRIPENIGDLGNLVTLDLVANRLTGPIPLSYLNLTGLRGGGSALKYNGLYSNDKELRDFLTARYIYWEGFQTIAPANVSASSASFFSIRVSWDPIGYKCHEGGYMVYYSTTSKGPWRYAGMTSDKYTAFYEVTGLIPGKTYYFKVKTKTYPHHYNANTVVSEASRVVSAAVSPNSANILGVVDTPVDGSIVRGSIPVSGWVIDDTGIESVKIYLEQGESLVFIGNAVFVEGARPDIEQLFPGFPDTHNAGWGYMMLTNLLPDKGNGIFTIQAMAADKDGNSVTLGTKTIICDNANAVKPFGTFDTPEQGGTVQGDNFVNFGWVLTPQPNTIPPDGSTITVWVDGVPLGHPVYNQYRADIASLFPGYNNSNGAVGYFKMDTTQYENGVHTIAWSVQDDAGNQDGIGSRYFTILNQAENRAHSTERFASRVSHRELNISEIPDEYYGSIEFKRGYNRDDNSEREKKYPNNKGIITVEVKELERVEIHLDNNFSKFHCGYQVVGNRLKALPVGSFLDIHNGIFSWQMGAGFVGNYLLVFIGKNQNGKTIKKKVQVTVDAKF